MSDITVQDNMQGFLDGIAFLNSHRVYVGIPQENAGRSGALTNVELAYLHSQGSPKMHIPARPFIEPGIEDKKEAIEAEMREAVGAALSGNFGAAMAHLDGAGQEGENGAKARIGTGAPNAPITINGGWMRNPVSGKPFYVKGKKSSKPLIDTGSLRSSITHVIKGE